MKQLVGYTVGLLALSSFIVPYTISFALADAV